LGQPGAVADPDDVVAMAGELVDLLGHLLEQRRGDVVRVPGGGELDHAPPGRAEDRERVEPVRLRVDELRRDDRDAEAALVALHQPSRTATSPARSTPASWPGSTWVTPPARGAGTPRRASSASSASIRIPLPVVSSGAPSGHSGRPPRSGSELVIRTPIDGLPSRPTSTTSSPRATRASIAPATALAIRSQWRRYASVSSCSRTAQKRLRPVNASSGQGICSISNPRSRRTSTSGEYTPGHRAPPSTFAFWLSRQCATNATRATGRGYSRP